MLYSQCIFKNSNTVKFNTIPECVVKTVKEALLHVFSSKLQVLQASIGLNQDEDLSRSCGCSHVCDNILTPTNVTISLESTNVTIGLDSNSFLNKIFIYIFILPCIFYTCKILYSLSLSIHSSRCHYNLMLYNLNVSFVLTKQLILYHKEPWI